MRALLAALCLLGLSGMAQAIDYRSVDTPAAILYDSPSQKGKKLYLIKAMTPVEVVVRLGDWSKVRDVEGSLAWIENRFLSEKRMLVVTTPGAELRQGGSNDAPVLARIDKFVAVELLDTATAGWAKVRHRDGTTGYLRSTQVWGL
jgi:SH3-like domain-containing protein